MKAISVSLAAALLVGAAQQKPKEVPVQQHPKVDQKRVDEAIQRGCEWIMGAGGGTFTHGGRTQGPARHSYIELVLLTLAHSGYYRDDHPQVQQLVEEVLRKEITSTYTASLMAMALQKLNARKYQMRIAECAQFLVDNQCTNGQWCYGKPVDTEHLKKTPTGGSGKARQDVATSGGAALDPSKPPPPPPKKEVGKTAPLPRVPVRKRGDPGPPYGDDSNSQYAALGVRACLDAGIDLESSVLTRARQWWLKSQNSDGGWGYCGEGNVGGGAENPDGVSNDSYGSMTVGAVGALCIYDYYLGINYKTDKAVVNGMEWITANFTVDRNPKKTKFHHYYYLYGLERSGILYGTEFFGRNEWYPVGANYLLDHQKDVGTWDNGEGHGANSVVETCFAILFLRRGTAPLKRENVATGEQGPRPGMPVANAPGVANPARRGGGDPVAKAFDAVSAGWTIENAGGGLNTGLRKELRGKENVFETFPSSPSAGCILSKKVEIPFGKKPTLRLVVGHHPQGEWKLVVRVEGKDVCEKVVGASTSKNTWLDVSVDLSTWQGQSVQVELVDLPTGNGPPTAAWAEISVRGE